MTKREAVAQLKAADFSLLADAAETYAKGAEAKDARKLKRAAKILRSVKAAK